MDYKLYIKLAIGAVAIFVGVQFSLAYINRTQLKSIMESEALDARRAQGATEDSILRQIENRCESTNVDFPEDVEFEITGIGKRDEPLIVTAWYSQPVELYVHTFYLEMMVEAVAGVPDRE